MSSKDQRKLGDETFLLLAAISGNFGVLHRQSEKEKKVGVGWGGWRWWGRHPLKHKWMKKAWLHLFLYGSCEITLASRHQLVMWSVKYLRMRPFHDAVKCFLPFLCCAIFRLLLLFLKLKVYCWSPQSWRMRLGCICEQQIIANLNEESSHCFQQGVVWFTPLKNFWKPTLALWGAAQSYLSESVCLLWNASHVCRDQSPSPVCQRTRHMSAFFQFLPYLTRLCLSLHIF